MKADQWDAWRAKWKSCLLSIPVSILDSGSENEPDRVWVKAFNRRQTVRQEHESLVRTAMQTALEIDQFRVICENQPGVQGTASARPTGTGICQAWASFGAGWYSTRW